MTTYYASTDTLDRLVDDLTVLPGEIIREAERLVRNEFGAADYYRRHPELLFYEPPRSVHPWLKFIESGEAPVCFGFLEDWWPVREKAT